MKRRFINIGYGIIVLWMIWPLVPVMFAGIVATSCGCKVDEGSVHPCIVLGKDIGELLYGMSMMGWFAIGTFPSGMIALAIFSVIVWRRNRSAAKDPDATDEEDVYLMKQDFVLWLGLASLLFSFLTSVPALIIAARSRPLATRARIGVTIAIFTLLANVIFPFALRLLRTN
jgi:hypothetical protein